MEKVIPKFVRIIKDLNSQSDLEKEEQNWTETKADELLRTL